MLCIRLSCESKSTDVQLGTDVRQDAVVMMGQERQS